MINEEKHQVTIPVHDYNLLIKDRIEYINEIDVLKDRIYLLEKQLNSINADINIANRSTEFNIKKIQKDYQNVIDKNLKDYETKLRRLKNMNWFSKLINK